VRVQPTAEALKALVTRIKVSGRAFAMFDLAKVVLGARDRYEIKFMRDKEQNGPELVRCKSDGSLWLSKEDAVRHFIHSGEVEKFYDVEETEVEPPKGNFTSIAVCGISGVLLGPPNHHAYQTNIIRLHRQRFSNMPLDRYKSRIRTETSEEMVEKWKESQSKSTHYLYPKKKVEEPEAEPTEAEAGDVAPAAPSEEAAAEAASETTEAVADAAAPDSEATEPVVEAPEEAAPEVEAPTEEPAAADAEAETTEEPVSDEAEAESAEPAEEAAESESEGEEAPEASDEESNSPEATADNEPEEEQERIVTPESLERHVMAHMAEKVFSVAGGAVVPGDIPGKMLAPGLLALLRNEVESLKRSPFPLVKVLCGRLESQGLKIFKRQGKKLFVAKARPRAVDLDTPMSESVRGIIEIVQARPGIRVSEMVTSLAPRAEGEPKPEGTELSPAETAVLTDLHWLVDEGFIIEYSSTALFLGGQPRHFSEQGTSKKTPPGQKKKAAESGDKTQAESEPQPAEAKTETASADESAASPDGEAQAPVESPVAESEPAAPTVEAAPVEVMEETQPADVNLEAEKADSPAASENVTEEVNTAEPEAPAAEAVPSEPADAETEPEAETIPPAATETVTEEVEIAEPEEVETAADYQHLSDSSSSEDATEGEEPKSEEPEAEEDKPAS